MNKLLYNETIKHINRSVIKIRDDFNYYNRAPHDITWCVYNPISGTSVYFIKNTVPQVSYNVSFGFAIENPFTAAESEQLFTHVEKRYNDHFKNADEQKISLYKRMLISNSMTRHK